MFKHADVTEWRAECPPSLPISDGENHSRFKLYVLGRFRLRFGDAAIPSSRRPPCKSIELLQALVAFGGTEVSVGKLADALWPDSDGDAAYRAFESTLYRLRQFLGVPDAVRLASGKLSLKESDFWVDMWEFQRALQVASRSGAERAERLANARQLYEGHFLEGETDKSWTLMPRQMLRDRFLRCTREEARIYRDRHEWSEAARVYQAALELDFLAEDLYRGLMVCQRELGDYSEAIQTYRSCRDLLTQLLGVPPNRETEDLYESVRQRALAETQLPRRREGGRCRDLTVAATLHG